MTDMGLRCRGYVKVPIWELRLGGYTHADAIFQKDFYKDDNSLKYTIVIEKYNLSLANGELIGPTYVGISVVHSKKDDTKEIGLSFSPTWSVDEIEGAMEQMYVSGDFVPSVK